MTGDRVARRLAAILAADVVGYSRLMGRDEHGTLTGLKAHRTERLEPVLARHGGRLVKLTGDGALVEFPSAVDALGAAIEFQQAMAEANLDQPEDTRIVFRIGLHLGDLIVDGDDLYGDGVNVAARLEAEAPAGGIVISGNVHDAVAGRLKATFDDLGSLALKNIERPVQAFGINWDPADWKVSALALAAPPIAVPPTVDAPLALPDKPSIAVLPFQNMSGDPEQEYFADGMVEDIITALSRFKSLFVIARNSSFTYKGKAVDIKQVGRDLGVRYVLEGSVRKAGGRVRITGQLIEAGTGSHLWAERFDGTLEDVFEVQDRVATSVVGVVASRLDQAERARVARKPVGNLDAYDTYLRGRAAHMERTRLSNDEALRLFYRAIEVDPKFATPYAFAARCYTLRKVQGWIVDKDDEIAETRRLVARVTEIGADDELALAAAGQAAAFVCGDYELAERMVDRAIALNQNSAFCWEMRAYVSTYLGQHDAVLSQVEKVARLNPLDPEFIRSEAISGYALIFLGRYDEAVAVAAKVLASRPNWLFGLRIAAAANALAGNLTEARRMAAELHRLDPDMRISKLRDFIPYRRPQDIERLIEGMRLAGLPE
ncbi:MAG: adenylate/guanylate cyclase domain-containing protein [Enhydrobacter sp.]